MIWTYTAIAAAAGVVVVWPLATVAAGYLWRVSYNLAKLAALIVILEAAWMLHGQDVKQWVIRVASHPSVAPYVHIATRVVEPIQDKPSQLMDVISSYFGKSEL